MIESAPNDKKRVTRANPMHIIIIADDSESMTWGGHPTPAEQATSALQDWIAELQSKLKGKNYFALSCITFGSSAEAICTWEWMTEIDARQLVIDGTSGTTNLAAALDLATQILSTPCPDPSAPAPAAWHTPWVFLYSDGVPDDKAAARNAALRLKSVVLPGGVPVVTTLGFGNQVDRETLSLLASSPDYAKVGATAKQLIKALPDIGSLTGASVGVEGAKKLFAEMDL